MDSLSVQIIAGLETRVSDLLSANDSLHTMIRSLQAKIIKLETEKANGASAVQAS